VYTNDINGAQGAPGLSFGKPEAKMGWNAQPTCSVTLEGVRVPARALLGQEGQGFKIAMSACELPLVVMVLAQVAQVQHAPAGFETVLPHLGLHA
jgi:alkylation response protein AidB-like acyl-CoA dehydrogenase